MSRGAYFPNVDHHLLAFLQPPDVPYENAEYRIDEINKTGPAAPT
jgi:hypothetical protein